MQAYAFKHLYKWNMLQQLLWVFFVLFDNVS